MSLAHRNRKLVQALVWALLSWIAVACATSAAAELVAVQGDGATEDPGILMEIARNLFNSRALLAILERPELTLTAFIVVNVIVFVETGLLIFCLPGDSLLVTAGMACYTAHWNLPLLLTTLCLSAVVGDSVGYSIGRRAGPKIFQREKSWFFNKEHLLKAHAFYEKHGGKTIILARFMPIIRTFAPVVAGAGTMEYRKFLFYNIFGGVGWVLSMTLLGYSLPIFLNGSLQYLLGNPQFEVQDHIEKIVIVVVFLSISPGIYVWLKTRLKKKQGPPAPAVVNEMANSK